MPSNSSRKRACTLHTVYVYSPPPPPPTSIIFWIKPCELCTHNELLLHADIPMHAHVFKQDILSHAYKKFSNVDRLCAWGRRHSYSSTYLKKLRILLQTAKTAV